MRLPRRTCGLVVALLVAGGAGAQAQLPTATVLRRMPVTGGYELVINGDTMIAFPDSIARNMGILRDALVTQREVNRNLQKMVDAHEQVLGQSDRLHALQRQLISVQDSQITTLGKEVDRLKRMKQGGGLSFELGAGASGSDTEPGVVAGLAVRRLRIWSLLQKSNSGGFVGVSFPIF